MTNELKARHPVDLAVGANVRARRRNMKMSQEGLAQACGLTFQQIQKYEKGANRISCSKLTEIAAALECYPGDLFPRPDLGFEATYPETAGDNWSGKARALYWRRPHLFDALNTCSDAELKALEAFLMALNAGRQSALIPVSEDEIDAAEAEMQRAA